MSYPPPSVPNDSPPPAGGRPKIKPGKGWYWVGALLIAGGLLGGAALGVAGVLNLRNSIEDFGRFKVEDGTGAATVTFEKPGEYSIYYESESKVCADLSATPAESCETVAVRGEDDPPAQLDISITSGDRSLPIGPAENSLDYSFSGFTGTEVATVDVDEAGSYSMVVETRREGEFAIALGKDVVATVLPWVLGAMALAAVGLILGLIILIVTGVKRRRRKREAAMAAATAYPSAPAVFAPVGAPPTAPPPVAPPPTQPVPPVVPVPVGAPPTEPAGTPTVPVPAPPPDRQEPVPVGGGLSSDDDASFAPPPGPDAWAAPSGGAVPPPPGASPGPPPPPAGAAAPGDDAQAGPEDEDEVGADEAGWGEPAPADAAGGPDLPPPPPPAGSPPPASPPPAPPGQGSPPAPPGQGGPPPAPPFPSPSQPASGASLPPPPPPPPPRS
jgi:hypothetical protein